MANIELSDDSRLLSLSILYKQSETNMPSDGLWYGQGSMS